MSKVNINPASAPIIGVKNPSVKSAPPNNAAAPRTCTAPPDAYKQNAP